MQADVNNMGKYHLKTIILRSGERLPMLLTDSGVPLYGPTVFSVAEVRNRHRASNTIVNALGALSVFQTFLDEHGIDLLARLDEGSLLELGEIEGLVRTCRMDLSASSPQKALVTSQVCASRLRTICKYIEWTVKGKLLEREYRHSQLLQQRGKIAVDTIRARIPPATAQLDAREGLAPETVQRVMDIVRPDSPENPWRTEHARVRNHLIWILLYQLGIRGGEFLGIRNQHINFRKGTLMIMRQADSIDDPRPRQPNAKTLARELALSEQLQKQVSDYILHYRRKLKNASKHDFLLVSESGSPLSYAALNKVFAVLRQKHPELPRNLTGHVLRHTWNDVFSEYADGHKIDEESEKRIRAYQMGWKPTSNSAAIYTRRTVRKKAQQVSLSLQSVLVPEGNNS
ncbi:MAG TPA: site-specific integrase [Terriglobales bacterium]|nr:site-specific integrase [Terriglobales bacterium]